MINWTKLRIQKVLATIIITGFATTSYCVEKLIPFNGLKLRITHL